jgi:hypothetical protein
MAFAPKVITSKIRVVTKNLEKSSPGRNHRGRERVMPKRTRKEQMEYLRSWLKKNPHYKRDWTRADRAAKRAGEPKAEGAFTVRILGVRIKVGHLNAVPLGGD